MRALNALGPARDNLRFRMEGGRHTLSLFLLGEACVPVCLCLGRHRPGF